jgi:hypothetical protein
MKTTKDGSKIPLSKRNPNRFRRQSKQAGDSLASLFHSNGGGRRRGKGERAYCTLEPSNRSGKRFHCVLLALGDATKAKSEGGSNLVHCSRRQQQKLRRRATSLSQIVVIDSLSGLGNRWSDPTKESLPCSQSGPSNLVRPTKRLVRHSKMRMDHGQFKNAGSKATTLIGDSLLWCKDKEVSWTNRKQMQSLRVGDIPAGLSQRQSRLVACHHSKGTAVGRSNRTKEALRQTKRQGTTLRKKRSVLAGLEGATWSGEFLVKPEQSHLPNLGSELEPGTKLVSPIETLSRNKTAVLLPDSVPTPPLALSEKKKYIELPEAVMETTDSELSENRLQTKSLILTSNASTGSMISVPNSEEAPNLLLHQVPLGSKITFISLPNNSEFYRPDTHRDNERNANGGIMDIDMSPVRIHHRTTSVVSFCPVRVEPSQREEPNLGETCCCSSSMILDESGQNLDYATSQKQTRAKLDSTSNEVRPLRRSKRQFCRPRRLGEISTSTDHRNDEIDNEKDERKLPDQVACKVVRRSKRVQYQPTGATGAENEKISPDHDRKLSRNLKDETARTKTPEMARTRSPSLAISASRSAGFKAVGPDTGAEEFPEMMIPHTSGVSEIANPGDETQDDIFHATPKRNPFQGAKTEDDFAVLLGEILPGKRSKRKSTRPERYGFQYDRMTFGSDTTGSNTGPMQAAMKEGNAVSQCQSAKKRVRVSSEDLSHRKGDQNLADHHEIEDHWTQQEIDTLRMAHKTVDPKSLSFWDDVSRIVSEKTAGDCREKWFSLYKTPIIKDRHRKIRDGKRNQKVTPPSVSCRACDDIFDATPMRSLFATRDARDSGCSGPTFEGLSYIFNGSHGSAIKVNSNHNNGNFEISSPRPIEGHKPGYKAYIQNIRRNLNRRRATRQRHADHEPFLAKKTVKSLAECADEGNVEMKCRLSPGGTLLINTHDVDDDEDYFYRNHDNVCEDDEEQLHR